MAIAFLVQDESQIRYYEKRLKDMPVKILLKHGVIVQKGDLISLAVRELTFEPKAELKMVCEERMLKYVASRGLSI